MNEYNSKEPLSVCEIELRKQKMAALMEIPSGLMNPRYETSEHEIFARNSLMMRLVAEVWRTDIGKIERIAPRDWWEAIKERFAPKWFTRRWPVRYDEITVECFAIFPELDLISPNRTIRVAVRRLPKA